jgi:hypothetical protein
MMGTVCFGRMVLPWSTARLAVGLLIAVWGFATPAWAQQNDAPKEGGSQASPAPAAEEAHELAKKLNNPIASLISVPLQSDVNCNIGPADDGCNYTLEIEPVIPVSIADDWNMISRTILPITYQNDIFPGAGDQFGLGDITQSLFFSPKAPSSFGGLIWGAGPAFLIPTATDDLLGTGKFGIGPTVVVLKQTGPWTIGILANHIWSVAGDDDRADVSDTFLQPFVAYTTKDAWTFSANTESSYDWKREQWSVPINAEVKKLLRIGKQPVQIGGGLRYWAESPESGPEGFGGRLIVTFLFPE